MKLSFLNKLVNGQLISELPDLDCLSFATDSRSLKTKDVFIALRGEHFDGHEFIAESVGLGVQVCIVDETYLKTHSKRFQRVALVVVENTHKAYGAIAAFMARESKAKKVAITGSCGKTSVKEMLKTILAEQGEVLATAGNFNNEVGVPKTLLAIEAKHDFAVIEMGANHQGEIAYLSDLVGADVVSLLNADRAHLEGFGSIEGVVNAKGEIFSGAKPKGTAVLSLDEPYFSYWRGLALEHNLSLVTVSLTDSQADIFLEAKQQNAQGFVLAFKIAHEHVQVSLPLLGVHNIKNLLIAIGIAFSLNIATSLIEKGIAKIKATKGRLNVIPFQAQAQAQVQTQAQYRNSYIIDDSYNANPLSVKAAIDVLSGYAQHRILILGDMLELGGESAQYHQEVGEYARTKNINTLIGYGEFSEDCVKGFRQLNEGAHLGSQFEGAAYLSKEKLISELRQLLPKKKDFVVLVKGSRSMAMEDVVEELTHFDEVG